MDPDTLTHSMHTHTPTDSCMHASCNASVPLNSESLPNLVMAATRNLLMEKRDIVTAAINKLAPKSSRAASTCYISVSSISSNDHSRFFTEGGSGGAGTL